MHDLMIDMETRGKGPGCAILSLGGVFFDPATGRQGATFERVVSAASCRALGLREDADTMAWWSAQSPQARQVLTLSEAGGGLVGQVLFDFAEFIRDHSSPRLVRVWGNGADFDNAILAYLYALLGMTQPWSFWNNRCFRTLKALPHAKALEPARLGTHHNALDDARHQASWAAAIFADMRAAA